MADVSQIIAEIEAVLDKATPGPWNAYSFGGTASINPNNAWQVSGPTPAYLDKVRQFTEEDAAYIAACNPVAIRALVEKVRRLEGHVELLQSKIDAEKSCACCYDTPDDVCAVHSPKLAAAEARAEAHETHIYELELQRDDAITRAEKADASLREAVEVLIRFHDAVQIYPTMEGPRFQGWNRSALDRALVKLDAFLAKLEKTND